MKTRYVDINVLLRATNLLVACLIAFAWLRYDALPASDYLDRGTLALGLVLCLQTQIALFLERRRRDPFFLLLAFWMILYYELRVYTLAVLPYSVVFDRFAYDATDSNFALLFILLANCAIYAGFYSVHLRNKLAINIGEMRARAPSAVIVLLLAAILFAYFRGGFWTPENVPRALNFLAIFLGPEMVILMALVYLWLFGKSLPRMFVYSIAGLIFVDIFAHTLWGSRSAIMGFAQVFLFTALAVLGVIRVRLRLVAIGIVMLPALMAVLVATFTIASYNRIAQAGATSLDVGRALQFARESSSEITDSPLVDLLLPPIAARAGYFDFSAEMIAHHEQYSQVMSFDAYARSFIDNIFTPGFDIYDQPKTANALRFVYLGLGTPSKAQVSEAYHSDQIGLYGEVYAFLGFAALPVLLVGAWALKRLYVNLRDRNPFLLGAKRALVLFVFLRCLDSFGVDWIVGEMIPYIVAIFTFSFLFTVRRARPERVRSSEGVLNAS